MDASTRNAASALSDTSPASPAEPGAREDDARGGDGPATARTGARARLLDAGYAFDFFQAVRLAEQFFPAAPPVGETADFAGERLRLRPSGALVFPAADVRRAERLAAGEDALTPAAHVRLTVTFLGLYGVDTPLPATFTEPSDLHAEDGSPSVLRHLLDIFNHRLYAFFYRSWKKHRPLLAALPPGQHAPVASDAQARRFLALTGLGTPGALDAPLARTLLEPRQNEHPSSAPARSAPSGGVGTLGRRAAPQPPPAEGEPALPPMRMAGFAGLLSRRTRSAEGLRALLAGFFEDLPVRIVENVGRWVPVAERPRMGGPGGARLGVNASVGRRVYDRSSKFRVELGPMDLPTFRALMPGRTMARQVRALLRLYVPDSLTYDVELKLKPQASQNAQLGAEATRLGRSTVLGRADTQGQVRVVEYE